MTTSILTSTKEALGLAADYDAFDNELIMHVNATLSALTQLGVGPRAGQAITAATETWEDFLGTDPRLNQAKLFMYLSVKLAFDPPTIGYVLTAFEKMKEEAAWRLTVIVDEPQTLFTGTMTSITGIRGDEFIIEVTNPEGDETINENGEYEATFVPKGRDWGRSVTLDVSEIEDGKIKVPIVIEDGIYYVHSLTPRRTTVSTIEVTAEGADLRREV